MPKPGEMPALEQGGLRLQPVAGRCRVPPAAPASPATRYRPKSARPSPIKHCIYIIKENRTYDQVFGDIREGNGDAALCIFPAAGHAQPSRPGPAVRAPGQFLCRRRSERQRPRMEHGRLCDRLRREGLAAGLSARRQARQGGARRLPVSGRRRDAHRYSLQRIPLGPLPRGGRKLSQLRRVHRKRPASRAVPRMPGSRAWKAISIRSFAASTWSTATSFGPTASSRN